MFGLTLAYLIEIFPFTIRAKGLAGFQTFGCLSNFFNTFVNPIGLRNIGWKYYLTYVCWLLCEATIVYSSFLRPKTPLWKNSPSVLPCFPSFANS